MPKIRHHVKSLVLHWPLKVKDAVDNWRHLHGQPRVLITRLSSKRAHAYRDFLNWVTTEAPELRSRMEFHRLPYSRRDWTNIGLHVSWAGDTLDTWSPRIFAQASAVAEAARRQGVPLLNPIENTPNTGKTRGAKLMSAAGVRTPRCVRITDRPAFLRDLGGLSFPLLLREERGHGCASLKIETEAQLHVVDFTRFAAPLAAEFIDTRSPRDGYYRKYRYFAAGEWGVTRHMQVNAEWEVRAERRIFSPELRDEELGFLSRPDPYHETLQAARRALGLDVIAFDYSLDQAGRVVIWEANSHPNLNCTHGTKFTYIIPSNKRSYALLAKLYLSRLHVAIPEKIESFLAGYVSGPNSAAPASPTVCAA